MSASRKTTENWKILKVIHKIYVQLSQQVFFSASLYKIQWILQKSRPPFSDVDYTAPEILKMYVTCGSFCKSTLRHMIPAVFSLQTFSPLLWLWSQRCITVLLHQGNAATCRSVLGLWRDWNGSIPKKQNICRFIWNYFHLVGQIWSMGRVSASPVSEELIDFSDKTQVWGIYRETLIFLLTGNTLIIGSLSWVALYWQNKEWISSLLLHLTHTFLSLFISLIICYCS